MARTRMERRPARCPGLHGFDLFPPAGVSPARLPRYLPVDRKPSISRRPVLTAALTALALLAIPAGDAGAQDRVARRWLPDLDLWQTTFTRFGKARHTEGKTQALWDLAGSVGQIPGQAGVPNQGYGRLRFGVQVNPVTSLQMRSELHSIAPGEQSPTGLATGRHTLRARTGTPWQQMLAFDTELRAHFHHLGRDRLAVSAVDVGPGGHLDGGAALTLAASKRDRKGGSKVTGFRLPVTLAARRIQYQDPGAPVEFMQEGRLSAGIEGVLIERDGNTLALELLGGSFTQRHYTLAMDTAGSPGGGGSMAEPGPFRAMDTREVRIDVAGIDTAFHEDDLLVTASGRSGWASMRNHEFDRSASLITFHYGFDMVGTATNETMRMGLGFGRDGKLSPDGRQMVAEYGVEARFDMTTEHVGGSLRGTASWITEKFGDDQGDGLDGSGEPREDRDILGRYAVHAELFRNVDSKLQGVQMGLYNVSSYEPRFAAAAAGQAEDWNPWNAPRQWNLEVGAFVRWSGTR